jgi:CHAT domain-containing protein
MAQFYHNLWQEKMAPLQALRQAQLTIYRHPERIAVPARADARSAPVLKPKVSPRPGEATPGQPIPAARRAPTRL